MFNFLVLIVMPVRSRERANSLFNKLASRKHTNHNRRLQDNHSLKCTILRELGISKFTNIGDRAIIDPGTVCLLVVTLRKRTETDSFTPNVTDGKLRVGATDGKVPFFLKMSSYL